VLGVINIYVNEGHKSTEEERDFLLSVANTLAGIIVRKRTELEKQNLQIKVASSDVLSELARLTANVTALEKMAISTAGSFNLDMLLEGIIQACTDISNASKGALYLFHKESNELVMRAEVGHKPGLRFNTRFQVPDNKDKPGIGLIPFVFLSGERLVLNSKTNIDSHPAHLRTDSHNNLSDDELCQAWVGIPIKGIASSESRGVIAIENTLTRRPYCAFSKDEIEFINIIAGLVSDTITKVHNYSENMNRTMTEMVNALSQAVSLQKRLENIVKTFNNITHADGTSIWLIEGSYLWCRYAIGHYEKIKDKANYDLNFELDCLPKGTRVGITAWIAKSRKMVHTKTYEEMYNHPHFRGCFDADIYPHHPYIKCESFIGAPLMVQDKILGVIKANKLTKPNNDHVFFTDEEAQFFRFLSLIAAFAIKSSQDFEANIKHDKKTITLFKVGSKCNELEIIEEILWYFLIGLTHNDGIGLNRAMWFKVQEFENRISLEGKMSVGPKNKEEGYKYLEKLYTIKGITKLDDALNSYRNNHFNVPTEDSTLQDHIDREFPGIIEENSQVWDFIKSLSKSNQILIDFEKCGKNLREFFNALESKKPIMFGLKIAEGQKLIGFCDYVYTPENERQLTKFNLGLINVFLNQIELAVSRIKLQNAEEDAKDKAWTDFSSITGHRIGTEVADISGALRRLRRKLTEIDNDQETRESVKRIDNSLERLKASVNDFQQLARLDKIKTERIDICELVEQANKDATVSEREGIAVDIKKKNVVPVTFGDKEKLLYTFKELLHNAFKSIINKEEGKVLVEIVYDDTKKAIILEFIDNGSGIESQYRDKIFDPGFKMRQGGTGLGLYIVEKYIKSHKGTIRLNDEDKGAHFVIELPVIEASEIISDKKILLVEDNKSRGPDIEDEIRGRYPSLGSFEWVKTESDGLKRIHQNSYDVILTDIRLDENILDDIGGINILQKAMERDKNNKVIVITSHGSHKVKDDARETLSILEICRKLRAYACVDINQPGGNYIDNMLDKIDRVLFNMD